MGPEAIIVYIHPLFAHLLFKMWVCEYEDVDTIIDSQLNKVKRIFPWAPINANKYRYKIYLTFFSFRRKQKGVKFTFLYVSQTVELILLKWVLFEILIDLCIVILAMNK